MPAPYSCRLYSTHTNCMSYLHFFISLGAITGDLPGQGSCNRAFVVQHSCYRLLEREEKYTYGIVMPCPFEIEMRFPDDAALLWRVTARSAWLFCF